jgi:glutaredoxin-like YruB-family protein
MSQPQVTIYTTPTCTYCRQAKSYFQQKGIQYVEKDVSVDRQAAMEMLRRSRQQGVPVITIGGETIIGFDRPRIERVLASSARQKPTLGLAVADSSRIALEHGVVPIFGAYVGRVAPGSPGERAGVQPRDIITEINLRPVRNADDVEKAMESVQPGGRIALVWVRGQQTMRSEVSV